MNVIVRPIITEKSMTLANLKQYTFEVDLRANALQITQAIEKQFSVTVSDVRMLPVRSETKRNRRGAGKTRRSKKAIVVLSKGKIAGFEIETEKPDDKKDHDHQVTEDKK